MITKGATDVILGRASYIQKNGKIEPMTAQDKAAVEKANEDYSRQGLRVLGVAYRKFQEERS